MSDWKRGLAGATLAAAAVWLVTLPAWTGEADVPYPGGYRSWAHVKSTLVGPSAPNFQTNGGLHHFYANDKALEGYRTGRFPDGAVLIDDLLELTDKGGVSSEGTRKRVAVMLKNSAKFPETGGWGFEVFRGDGTVAALTGEARAACFKCHSGAPRESVFSELRK
jgi:cytochrome P460